MRSEHAWEEYDRNMHERKKKKRQTLGFDSPSTQPTASLSFTIDSPKSKKEHAHDIAIDGVILVIVEGEILIVRKEVESHNESCLEDEHEGHKGTFGSLGKIFGRCLASGKQHGCLGWGHGRQRLMGMMSDAKMRIPLFLLFYVCWISENISWCESQSWISFR